MLLKNDSPEDQIKVNIRSRIYIRLCILICRSSKHVFVFVCLSVSHSKQRQRVIVMRRATGNVLCGESIRPCWNINRDKNSNDRRNDDEEEEENSQHTARANMQTNRIVYIDLLVSWLRITFVLIQFVCTLALTYLTAKLYTHTHAKRLLQAFCICSASKCACVRVIPLRSAFTLFQLIECVCQTYVK